MTFHQRELKLKSIQIDQWDDSIQIFKNLDGKCNLKSDWNIQICWSNIMFCALFLSKQSCQSWVSRLQRRLMYHNLQLWWATNIHAYHSVSFTQSQQILVLSSPPFISTAYHWSLSLFSGSHTTYNVLHIILTSALLLRALRHPHPMHSSSRQLVMYNICYSSFSNTIKISLWYLKTWISIIDLTKPAAIRISIREQYECPSEGWSVAQQIIYRNNFKEENVSHLQTRQEHTSVYKFYQTATLYKKA